MGTLQENQSLNAEYERNKKEREMKEEIERLNNIINKAIKYIEDTSHKSYFSMLQADYNMSLDTLINILKGSDKENV